MIGARTMPNYLEEINDHIAVSSLESPEHAIKKNPRIITITWFLGKRCNFDCSYCSSYTHDNYSPHLKKEKAFHFLDQLEMYSIEQKKDFKLQITGGEPFVHPNFLEILKYAKEKNKITQLLVTTNGSLPLHIYEKSSEYLTNITVSLHLEQSDSVINDTVDKIINLNQIKKWFINVNLMALPGKLQLLKAIIEKFEFNKVKFVLRKIDPPNEHNKTTIRKQDLPDDFSIEIDEKDFSQNKIKKKNDWNEVLNFDQYYSEEELKFFNNFTSKNNWQNIKLHWPNRQLELNTDDLKLKNLNSWKGWKCYIGIDSIYVQHTGEIFRGNCMQGEPIGRIGEKLNWPVEPIVCPIKWCICNADMMVRKAKDNNFTNLIDD
jgi:MoaA/NifB/PqqE/SkfB family radical SAM enzyme